MTIRKKTHSNLADSKPIILITDSMHPLFMQGLKQNGFSYDYQPDITPQQALAIIEKYTGIVVNSKLKIDKNFIDRAKNLRFVARAGSGIENVDVKYLEKKRIQTISSPEGNRNAVGEHTVGMLLALLHKINKSDSEVRKKIWLREENRGIELQGKTLGIIGYGNTGSAFAEKLKGFGVNILAYDKYKRKFGNREIREVRLNEIFTESDIVSFHIPLTTETEYMVNDVFLNKFKKNIFLLNTSRGKILWTADLIKAMKKGKVLGAALDVFENEKIDDLTKEEKTWFDYLSNSAQVVLTPHIAGWSVEAKERIGKVLLKKIKRIV